MNRTIRILTFLAVMAITAGQAWAGVDYDLGHIIYTQGANDGGELKFYHNSDCLENSDVQFDNGKSRYKLSSEELTDRTVYIKATPDLGYTIKDMTITYYESIGSDEAQAPSRRAPGVNQDIHTVTAVDGKIGVYCFQMPDNANNVTVTAEFKAKTNLTGVKFIDANGTEQATLSGTKVWVLDGAELFLGKSDQETWYVCNSDLDYNHTLNIYGNLHLILGDGAEMTVNSETGPAIESTGALTLYGQGGETEGKLIATTTANKSHAMYMLCS